MGKVIRRMLSSGMRTLLARSASLSFVLAALAFAPRADAFCRTVTQPAPPDYNAQAQGCFTGVATTKDPARFLYWKSTCVGYSIQKDASKQVTFDQATAAMANAFAAWSDATCPSGGNPSVGAVDEGAVDCSEVRYNQDGANQHVITFRDTEWPHNDSNNTLALTTVTFDLGTGEIYDADMEINSTPANKIVVSGPVPAGSFDFASIVTHEAGHFLGLAHSTQTSAVMFAHYRPGSLALTADDIAGICTIYPAGGARATSLGSIDAAACDPKPRHGYATTCDAPSQDPPASTKKGGCAIAMGAVGGEGAGNFGQFAIGLGGLALVGLLRRRRANGARGARVLRMKRFRAAFAATFLSVAAAGAASLITSDAQASVSIAILFDELVRDATGAAVVTPVEQRSVWENGRIYTYTRVHVDSNVAGSVPNDAWVQTMGGAVGKIGQLVEGEAVLTVGRPSLLFLQPHIDPETKTATSTFVVTARAQGQFPVTLDEKKVPRLIHAHGVGALMPPSPDRVARVAQMRKGGGVPELAQDVLHNRPVEEATREIALAWSRLHAP
jgi:hypothetical protein